MSRKKTGSKPVQQKRKADPFHCGTITAEQQRKMQRANERKERIASGVLGPTGSGAHWRGKKGENRADRRASRQESARISRGDF